MNSASRKHSPFTSRNKVKLIQGGAEYFILIKQLIDEAKYSIQLQVYIFDEDETGNEIIEKLISAAKRGVKVQLLLDGYASRNISTPTKKKLRNEGVYLRFFEPILKNKNYYFGRRLHHKIIVVDAIKSLVGGINISDRYNDVPGAKAWLDWAVFIEGEASFELSKICNNLYSKSGMGYIPTPTFSNTIQESCNIRIRRNDWVMNLHQVSAGYMQMLKNAQKNIIIMSSYFIPGRFFRRQIEKARERGIRIQIILAGMSDVGISKNAEKYFYRWALRNGLELYEYQSNILHGKIAVADETISTVGSYNINDISALASIELNVDVLDKHFSTHVHQRLVEIIKNECRKVEHENTTRETNWVKQFIQWASYEFYRLTFTLFTFYFKKKRKASY